MTLCCPLSSVGLFSGLGPTIVTCYIDLHGFDRDDDRRQAETVSADARSSQQVSATNHQTAEIQSLNQSFSSESHMDRSVQVTPFVGDSSTKTDALSSKI